MSHIEFPADCRDPVDRHAWVEGLRNLRRAELVSDAARAGTIITAWYDDLGVSGLGEARDRRTDFARLRADACRGRVRAVYARDLSRLFRDLLQQELWFAEMEACGVAVYAQDLPFTPDAATRRLLRQQIGAMHEFQARRQGAVIQAVLQERVAAGVQAGMGRSYWGLRFDHATKGFVFDPATADHARLVFETFVAEGGAAAAARTLNRMLQEGHPRATLTPGGALWTDCLVLLRMRKPVYRRRVAFGGLVRDVPALIPEVVPPALVAQADALLAARHPGPKPPTRRTNTRHDYGGLLRCGVCGAPVYSARYGRRPRPAATGGTAPDRRPVAWSCSAANTATGGGHGGLVTQERLDALVGRALAAAFRGTHAPPDPSSPDLNPPDLNPPDLNPPDLNPPDLNPPDLNPTAAAPEIAPLLARTASSRRRALHLYATGLLTDADALRRHLEALDAQEARLRVQIGEAATARERSLVPPGPEARRQEEARREQGLARDAAFRQLGAAFRRLWGSSGAAAATGGVARETDKRAFLKSAGVRVRLKVHPRAGQTKVQRGPRGGRATVRVDLAALGLVGRHALRAAETEAELEAADALAADDAAGRRQKGDDRR